jgi:galactokinase
MSLSSPTLRVSSPGRICLFGEHQDYLHLPVVPCAISLRIAIAGTHRTDTLGVIDLPDIGGRETFPLESELTYGAERDYFKSTFNVLRRRGFTFSRGVQCTVRGEIPINSGTSSSSALIVAWANFLMQMSDQVYRSGPDELARIAHEAEVVEFGEPGGMMDHFSTAFGGVIAIDFHPEITVHPLHPQLGPFVLGDSGEPKDTRGILARVKNRVLAAAGRLLQAHPDFSLQTVSPGDLDQYSGEVSRDENELLIGTLRNRELTREARLLLGESKTDHRALGRLLNEHQTILREVLQISTPKIDRMLSAAINAGAYGGKINGSGGGGCMFVYAPEDPERAAAAIAAEGGRAFLIRMDAGARNDEQETVH